MDTNTFVGNLVDRGPWILYDTVTVAQAASTGTTLQPFSLPISATKTKLATNMTKANQLPTPQRFLLQGVGFFFDSKTLKADVDLFVTTGGISVGAHDLVKPALNAVGAQTDLWCVLVKPGKPFLFGHAGHCSIFGLPGNPVRTSATLHLYPTAPATSRR